MKICFVYVLNCLICWPPTHSSSSARTSSKKKLFSSYSLFISFSVSLSLSICFLHGMLSDVWRGNRKQACPRTNKNLTRVCMYISSSPPTPKSGICTCFIHHLAQHWPSMIYFSFPSLALSLSLPPSLTRPSVSLFLLFYHIKDFFFLLVFFFFCLPMIFTRVYTYQLYLYHFPFIFLQFWDSLKEHSQLITSQR